jgi:hypothetical protein
LEGDIGLRSRAPIQDVLADALDLALEEGELDVEDLRAAVETLLPTLYDALREAGFGGLRERGPAQAWQSE